MRSNPVVQSGRRALFLLVLLAGLAGVLTACGGDGAFTDEFDRLGSWGSGNNADVEGTVANGVYELHVKADTGLFWATAGKESLGEGIYELDATQVDGPLDNGFGLMLRADNETDNFVLFEVSGDGFVWIGWCEDGCEAVADPLVNDGWFESKAVREGLNATNRLRVDYGSSEMVFSVNGQEVGRAGSAISGSSTAGDIGLLVETLGLGGVRVAFDNFRYSPQAEE